MSKELCSTTSRQCLPAAPWDKTLITVRSEDLEIAGNGQMDPRFSRAVANPALLPQAIQVVARITTNASRRLSPGLRELH